MKISVNGVERQVQTDATVMELLGSMELEETRVAVERNREIVPRADYDSTRLAEGDRIEIVHFVGGG
jgi:thiazole synthase